MSIDIQCVQQIILVEIGAHGGERADKAVQEQRNIVLEDVDLPEDLIQKLLDAIAREDFIYSG